jgi:type IV secretion system protein VirB1
MHWFQQHHLTVSVGLMQINVENARRVGFTPEELFEPCANVAVGAWILKTNFSKALKLYGSQQDALYAAFSAYNTGSLTGGTGEEYASRILANARRAQFTSKPPKVKRTAP